MTYIIPVYIYNM